MVAAVKRCSSGVVWIEEIDAFDTVAEWRKRVCVDEAGPHTMTRFPSRECNVGLRMRGRTYSASGVGKLAAS
jgi:hypothetical protein